MNSDRNSARLHPLVPIANIQSQNEPSPSSRQDGPIRKLLRRGSSFIPELLAPFHRLENEQMLQLVLLGKAPTSLIGLLPDFRLFTRIVT